MNHRVDEIGFRELDGLLERAYALDGAARTEFVGSLPEPQRGRLRELLQVSEALPMRGIAANARAMFESLDRRGDDEAEGGPSPVAGRWRLHKELGAGGMGQVFFATREAPNGAPCPDRDYVQEAAIKVLWSLKAGEEVRARFLRERRLLASLNHPGLARFVDGGFLADGRPWFAMEYVAGSSIDAHALNLSIRERLQLFNEVCASVAYAHQRLIVHRDIKPMNVLVDGSGRARLLDFGIAGVLEDIDDGIHTRTAGGPLTLQYASPEQITGGVVTVASDIYQLGLLLYEMLAGAQPYHLGNAALAKAIDAICKQIPPKPSRHNPSVDRDLDAIVMTALAKNPDERYRAATDLAEDVERYLGGRPIRALPQTPWYVARRFLRRNAVVASIVGMSAVALTAATVVSVSMAKEATAQAARSAAAQQILSDVFQKADPFKGRGSAVTLAEALVRAKPDIAARLHGDPLLAWEVNHTLAQIYESLGLVEEELSAYKAMLWVARQMGEDHSDPRFLTGVAGIGNVLARTNPAEAVSYFDANLPARPASERVLDAWLSAQYAYVGALARVRELGRADAGTFTMAQVMEAFGVEDPRKRGRLSQLLAGVAKRSGDTASETQHWQDTVEYMRATQSPSALAVTLNNWAIHLGRTKRYKASEAAFLEALEIYESVNLKDPTFAAMLRSYAGLLFRTGRTDEAIAATEKALSLLQPSTQFYARFVAELNLTQYYFVKGDIRSTMKVLTQALSAARRASPGDTSAPKRMLRLFAKTLVFGRAFHLASTSLGFEAGLCQTERPLLRALETLEHPRDQKQRTSIWDALASLEAKSASHPLEQTDLNRFLALYEREAPVFFDVLDAWRVLDRLSALPTSGSLPAAVKAEHRALVRMRRDAATIIGAEDAKKLTDLAGYLSTLAAIPPGCP